jgi:prepilin-type N-terminal cleavage/methylation domain-containing protein
MKKNGFTLVELLAVIVILGILTTLVSVNVAKYINDSKKKTNEIALANLQDAAVTYGLDKLKLPKTCFATKYNSDGSPNIPGCSGNTIKVKELKDNGYFSDDKKVCNENAEVILYWYKGGQDQTNNQTNIYYELKSYVSDSVCQGN